MNCGLMLRPKMARAGSVYHCNKNRLLHKLTPTGRLSYINGRVLMKVMSARP